MGNVNMKKYVLAIDQGTTSTKAILIDKNGKIVSSYKHNVVQYFPEYGYVEMDAEQIFSSVLICVQNLLNNSMICIDEIDSIGITNQRETTILWDKVSGKPLYNAIVWQSRQSDDICNDLKSRDLKKYIFKKTGLLIDPYFSATKIMWLIENVENIKEKIAKQEVLFGTVESWLVYKLTGGIHVTDVTNASRTMLFNINTLSWDTDLLNLFKIDCSILPRICSNSEYLGNTDPDIFLGLNIPITSCIGDQQASLFGQQCFEQGSIKCTYGTGTFLLVNTANKPYYSSKGLLTTVAWKIVDDVCYALEGSVFATGSAVNWLKDNLNIIANVHETSQLAYSVNDNGGVYLVPAFVGLGTPHWDQDAKGSILGLTRASKKAHIVRSCLEAIAYQVKDVVSTMEESTNFSFSKMVCDGGLSNNNFILQFQSDILGFDIFKSQIDDSTALGAAYLAGLATGFFESLEHIKELNKTATIFKSNMDCEYSKILYSNWKLAVNTTMLFKPTVLKG